MDDWSRAKRWLYAAKVASWPKLLVPTILGQAIGAQVAGTWSWLAVVFGLTFAVADLLVIVFLNDWSDAPVDTLKRTMFPNDCSPKTLPDRILPSGALLTAGLAAGVAALALGGVAQVVLGRAYLGAYALMAVGIFWLYSLPPFRLNYRGGGEVLEAFGVGLVLPGLNSYAQSGQLFPREAALLAPFFAASFASAVASGLADERSDRRGGKRTVASVAGNLVARRVAEISLAVAVLGWLGEGLVLESQPLAIAALSAGVVALVFGARMVRWSARALTDAFEEQRHYKTELHRAIWWSALAAVAGLALGSLL